MSDISTIRKDLAASTMRQVARLFDDQSREINGPMRQELIVGSRAAHILASRIEEGLVEGKEWEFLVWLQDPLTTVVPLAPPATSAEKPSSGLKKRKPESVSPSTPIPQPTSLMDVTYEGGEEGFL